MKSIIQSKKECYICGTTSTLHDHHIFIGNPNRKNSEKYGLKIWLCQHHHEDHKEGVHHNKKFMDELHRLGQMQFELKCGTREEFRQIFGKSWL